MGVEGARRGRRKTRVGRLPCESPSRVFGPLEAEKCEECGEWDSRH